MDVMNEPLTWTEPVTAKKLNLALPTLRKLVDQGSGPPCILVNGRRRYRPTSVMAWLEALEKVEAA
ncbi:hypothetical protein CCC_03126 [Paramagnetospirillum magnetotacticum MS-1]|uniref:Helix-turn-helix domain-containing protein n=1 Tax=Paramagnetospirillum magnetotacticum MS-1 TaxID=272627 RepID=A0A0C2YZL2_PARME|nr:helix-turn-helix domain-containing protein [Paramagnetospirillum magnetotacticum]KIM00524.1 hypothetical protein CCC_03126 [Paramagnetospirillum magnetotacticum MS-1]